MKTIRIREVAASLASRRALACAAAIAAVGLTGCQTMSQCPSGSVKTAIAAPYAVYFKAGPSPSMPDTVVLVEDTHDVTERCVVEIKPENGADCVPPRSRPKVINGVTYCVYP
jgi:hypothetical protein